MGVSGIDLLYGRSTLPVTSHARSVPTVIEKRAVPVLAERRAAVECVLAELGGGSSLREVASVARSNTLPAAVALPVGSPPCSQREPKTPKLLTSEVLFYDWLFVARCV